MKLAMALRVAEHLKDKTPAATIYRARNGQFMTTIIKPPRTAREAWTPAAFIAAHKGAR